MKAAFLSTIILSLFAKTATARPVVAVFEIQDSRKAKSQFDAKTLGDLTEYLGNLLTETGIYTIVPTSDLKAALTSQKSKSYDSCYDESCQIQIGKEVAAEKTLSTKINKFGKKCVVQMGLYDLRKAASEKAATHRGACDTDALTETLEILVKKLAGQSKMVAAQAAVTKPPPASVEITSQEEPKAPSVTASPSSNALAEAPLEKQEEDGGSIFASPWFWIIGAVVVAGSVIAIIGPQGEAAPESPPTPDSNGQPSQSGNELGTSGGALTLGAW